MATKKKSLKSRAEDPTDKAVGKTTYFKVHPDALCEEEGFNVREYDDPEVIEHIEGFADSYANGRYVPPLVVRVDPSTGQIFIIEGHCRRKGALLAIERGANLVSLDAVPFEGNDAERVGVMLRSAEGLKLKPLAIAMGYLRLKRMGHSNADIAKDQRKTTSHVEQMLLLATANYDVHKLVREGKVEAGAAIDAVREYRDKAGDFLAGKFEEVVKRGKTKVTRGAIKEWTPPRRVVSSVIGTVESVVARLDKHTRLQLAQFEGQTSDQLAGKKIEIDAASFLDLVKAHGAVLEAKTAKENSETAARAAAAQQKLPTDGDKIQDAGHDDATAAEDEDDGIEDGAVTAGS